MTAAPINREPIDVRALSAVAICSVIWGTTWFAITLQLGVVDPTISVVYRFALAAAVLFCSAWQGASGWL